MELPLGAGFVLRAIIPPPDAIAATAIADRLKVPRRVVTVLEGESLVNDATALVAYRFAVLAVIAGSFSLARASGQFFIVGIGGILIGLAVGWLAEQFHKRVDDAPIEITVSLLTPFAAYLSAERLGVSGVLAVVTAGLHLGRRMPELLTFKTRLQGGPVLEMRRLWVRMSGAELGALRVRSSGDRRLFRSERRRLDVRPIRQWS